MILAHVVALLNGAVLPSILVEKVVQEEGTNSLTPSGYSRKEGLNRADEHLQVQEVGPFTQHVHA